MPDENDVMKRMILNDGTVLEDCECGYFNKCLWCSIKNVSFYEAFLHFSTPEKFKTVTFEMILDNVVHEVKYSGIERVTAIQQDGQVVEVRLEGYSINAEEAKKNKLNEVGE